MNQTIEEFLSYLSNLDIKLWVDGDRLHCSAPKGVLTATLQAQLAERKAELLTFLNQYNFDRLSARYQPLPTLTPNLAERYESFPLNEMQQAYWIGRNSFFEGGMLPSMFIPRLKAPI